MSTPSLAPTDNPPIQVGIVEDDQSIREGLAFLIEQSPGFQCVAACGSAEEALLLIPHSKPGIVLMDISLPGMSGIECIRALKKLLPGVQIMMLTVFEDHARIFQSLQAGATGYLLKKESSDLLLNAIADLHNGGSPMSNQIARRVVRAFQNQDESTSSNASFNSLSPREQEILSLLAQGYLYKEIAKKLLISLDTVRTHIRHIYEKLQVRSRTEAVNKAFPR
jgi:DNA-binding NarL/FixJ family response regulator